MEHVKIQINSAEAIKNLLGDSPELRLEFKNKVVDHLIKDHIQPLFGRDEYAKLTKQIEEDVAKSRNAEVAKIVFAKDKFGDFILSEEVKKMIKDKTNFEVCALIDKFTKDTHDFIECKVTNILKDNKLALENYITSEIDAVINEKISDRMEIILKHITDLSKYYATQLAEAQSQDKPRKITLDL